MRKLFLFASLSSIALLLASDLAQAKSRGRGCSGGGGSSGGCGGGYAYGGCSSGGCGGGYAYGGCASGGCYSGGYAMGCSTCGGGYAAAPVSGYCATCFVGGGKMAGTARADAGGVATLVVTLPADARLTIDGKATTSTSARRVFESPALETGKEYSYTLKASFLVDGVREEVSRQVTVRANETVPVTLAAPVATAKK